jgi:hypothetical protein
MTFWIPFGSNDGRTTSLTSHLKKLNNFRRYELSGRTAAITDVQHLLGCPASVKTTEKAYAAFVKNERFKQTVDFWISRCS